MKIKLVQVITAKMISKNRAYLIAGRIEARQGELERDGANILLRPFDYQVLMTSSALMDKTKLSAEVAVDRSIAMLKADESEIQEGNLKFEVIVRRATADLLTTRAELSPEVTIQVYQGVEELIERLNGLLKYVPPTVHPLPDAEDSSTGTLQAPGLTTSPQEAQKDGDEFRRVREEEQFIGMSDKMEASPLSSVGDEASEADNRDAGEVYSSEDIEVGTFEALKGNLPVLDETAPGTSEINDLATIVADESTNTPSFAHVIGDAEPQQEINDYGRVPELTAPGTLTPSDAKEIWRSVTEFVRLIQERGVIEYALTTQPSDFLFASYCLHSILPGAGRVAMTVASSWADFVDESEVEVRNLTTLPEEILISFENLEFELEEERESISRALDVLADPAS